MEEQEAIITWDTIQHILTILGGNIELERTKSSGLTYLLKIPRRVSRSFHELNDLSYYLSGCIDWELSGKGLTE